MGRWIRKSFRVWEVRWDEINSDLSLQRIEPCMLRTQGSGLKSETGVSRISYPTEQFHRRWWILGLPTHRKDLVP
jgi:hypothetical protein